MATHLHVFVVESSSKSVGQVAHVEASVQVAQVSIQSKRYGSDKLPRQSVPETYFLAGHSQRLFAVFRVNCEFTHVAQVVPLVQVAQVAMQSNGNLDGELVPEQASLSTYFLAGHSQSLFPEL